MKTFKYTLCVSFSNIPATLKEILLKAKYKLFLFCFSGGSVVKKPLAMQESPVWPIPVSLLGKFHGQKSLASPNLCGRKSQTWLSDETTTVFIFIYFYKK